MATKESILAELTRRFAELGRELGFSEPVVRDVAGWETHLFMLRKGHALKMEILWTDAVVFVYVLRLEDGKIPTGYVDYVDPDGTWRMKSVLEIYNALPDRKQKKKRLPRFHSWDEMEPHYYRSLKALDLIRENPEVLLNFMDSIDKTSPVIPKKIRSFLARE